MKNFNSCNVCKQNFKDQKLKKKLTKIGFSTLAVFLSFTNFNCAQKEDEKKYDENDALAHSHVYIQNKLLSPGSAQFEIGTDGVKKINDTTFIVNSYVDSQNKFGALLRSEYSLKIIFHPKEDSHDIVDAVIK